MTPAPMGSRSWIGLELDWLGKRPAGGIRHHGSAKADCNIDLRGGLGLLTGARACGAAGRNDVRSRQGGPRPHLVARAALHGLPEPVDRRFRGAAGTRYSPPG